MTIVIKIGSSTLTDKSGKLDTKNLKSLAKEAAELVKMGRQVVLVTSGAIVTGSERLKLKQKPKSIPEKQAAAAVGQSLLMRQYEKAFEEYGIPVAQVLLTRDAIAHRERYLNARHAFEALLNYKVVPIINENDTVAIDELKVGDNDNLSALVASLIGADLLILLTDVDGFYLKTDEGVPYKADLIEEISEEVESAAGHPSTQLGTGGMVTKLQAVKICSDAGIPVIIAHGGEEGIVLKAASGEKIGTFFKAKDVKPESRKRWLAHGLLPEGKLIIDPGAETALKKKGTSLLPVGIKEVRGKFNSGSLVVIASEIDKEVARGLVSKSSDELKKIIGKKEVGEAIHRDNLVIL